MLDFEVGGPFNGSVEPTALGTVEETPTGPGKTITYISTGGTGEDSFRYRAQVDGGLDSGDRVTMYISVLSLPIAIVKTAELDMGGDGAISAGDIITYTYTVTNPSDDILYDVTVTENPGDFSGTGTLPVPGSCTGGQALGNGAAPDIPVFVDPVGPEDSVVCTATYAITQADINAGEVLNRATANGTSDGNAVEDQSDEGSIYGSDPTQISLDTGSSILDFLPAILAAAASLKAGQ